MKRRKIFKSISFVFIISLILINPLAVYADMDNNLFSKEEVVEDVEFLFERMEKVHPNLYYSISKEEVENRIQDALKNIEVPANDMEIYKGIAPVLSSLKDGHTFINYPKSFGEKIMTSESLIPIEVIIRNGKILVKNILIEEHYNKYKDYEIISINSKDSEKIYEEMKNYVFGEQKSFIEAMVSKNFITLYYINNDFNEKYILELKDTNGSVTKLELLGKTVSEVKRFIANKGNESQKSLYKYSILDDSIALIEFNSFSDFEGFKVFLDESFKDIKEKGINELIIDLRENGGGNSSLGDLLVEYIYDGKYKSISRLEIKVSQALIDYYQENNYLGEDELNTFKEKLGERYSFNPSATRSFMEDSVFNGDIYFLIGKNTFSSAVMLSATVKDYNIGYLIGEETGGLATHYGDIYSFELPNTKLALGVSHKYFVRPNGLDTGRGVLPDYYEKDINKDALDIAIDIIKSKRQ